MTCHFYFIFATLLGIFAGWHDLETICALILLFIEYQVTAAQHLSTDENCLITHAHFLLKDHVAKKLLRCIYNALDYN